MDKVLESVIDEVAEEKNMDRRVVKYTYYGFLKELSNEINNFDPRFESTYVNMPFPGIGRIVPKSNKRISSILRKKINKRRGYVNKYIKNNVENV